MDLELFYAYNFYVDCLLELLDSGLNISEGLQDLILDTEPVYETRVKQVGSFYRVTTVVELKGRYFAIDWYRSLSETGEYKNKYPYQPYEVVPINKDKTEWRRKNR